MFSLRTALAVFPTAGILLALSPFGVGLVAALGIPVSLLVFGALRGKSRYDTKKARLLCISAALPCLLLLSYAPIDVATLLVVAVPPAWIAAISHRKVGHRLPTLILAVQAAMILGIIAADRFKVGLPFPCDRLCDRRTGDLGIAVFWLRLRRDGPNSDLVANVLGKQERRWEVYATDALGMRDGTNSLLTRSAIFRSDLPELLKSIESKDHRNSIVRSLCDDTNQLRIHQSVLLVVRGLIFNQGVRDAQILPIGEKEVIPHHAPSSAAALARHWHDDLQLLLEQYATQLNRDTIDSCRQQLSLLHSVEQGKFKAFDELSMELQRLRKSKPRREETGRKRMRR